MLSVPSRAEEAARSRYTDTVATCYESIDGFDDDEAMTDGSEFLMILGDPMWSIELI